MNRAVKLTLIYMFAFVCAAAVFSRYFTVALRATVRPEELYTVMVRQLEALQAEDFPRAYEQTSLGMQQRFDLPQFMEMARADYGAALLSKRIEFGQFLAQGQHAVLQVFFLDRNGTVTPCFYSFVKEERGWRIDGMRLLRRWDTGRRLAGVRA